MGPAFWLGAFTLALLVAAWPAAAQHATPASPLAAADAEARQLQLAPSLQLTVWAAEPQFENPVAFSLIPIPGQPPSRGVEAFIAETHRYGISVLDVTQNTPWLLNDLSFRNVDDRSDFLLRQFATNTARLTHDSEIIRRVTDSDGDGRADRSTVFADDFRSVADGTAASVLARGDQVWFGNIPNLWRLGLGSASTNAGATSRESLAHGFGVHIGVTGHDLHGLILGPDQRLYASFGDRGLAITNREGVALLAPDTGGVVRCNPDGSQLTLFCTGLRNPQELAFDDAGNLFTVDNDTAGPDPCRVLHLVEGADYGWRASYQHMKGFGPWVSEELWRGGLDGIPSPAGQVSQGPAGLAFYPGTGFGDRFAGRFVHCDFPGGLWSFQLKPAGATFVVADPQKLVWNCWPTDVEFGPDGALYILDWVAGWNMPKKGRIYRITPSGVASPEPVDTFALLQSDPAARSSDELLRLLDHADYRVRLAAQWELARQGRPRLAAVLKVATQSTSTRARRHALWTIHQILRRQPPSTTYEDGPMLSEIAGLLLDSEVDTVVQALRLLADFSATQDGDLLEKALSHDNARVRFEARFAAAKRAAPTHRSALVLPVSQRVLNSIASALGFEALAQRVGTLTPANTASPDFGVVGYFASSATESALETFAWSTANTAVPTQLLVQHALLRKKEATLFHPQRLATVLTLRRAASPDLAQFLDDPDPRLRLEAARAIHDLPVTEALPALAALLDDSAIRTWDHERGLDLPGTPPSTSSVPTTVSRRTPRDQILLRALNAHYRLGAPTNAAALARFASASAPGASTPPPPSPAPALRAEALFLLGEWAVAPAEPGHVPVFPKPDPNHGAVPSINPENWPGWFDRVVGLWRPLPPRPANAARDALAPLVRDLLQDPSTDVAHAALVAAGKLRLASAAPDILARLRDRSAPTSLRARALAILETLDADLVAEALPLALSDPSAELQAAALPLLGRLQGDDGVRILSEKLRAVTQPGTESAPLALHLAQAAFSALANSRSKTADPVLAEFLPRLTAGTLPSSLHLDLIEAVRARPDSDTRDQLQRWLSSRPAEGPDFIAPELLSGGDATRGRTLFAEKAETQCARCHRVGSEGGIVGPALDDVGARLDRRQLAQSILYPNALVAAGYESAQITLADGTELSGTVRHESAETVTLVSLEGGEQILRKADIRERRKGLSAMPEGYGELVTRRELRDLLEYLASLRQRPPG